MVSNCNIILKWSATPEQLSALGTALWRWCKLVIGDAGIYQLIDNQALANLVAGKLPQSRQMPWQADRQGVSFRVRDEISQNRQATIASLRRELPAQGVEDVLIDGKSWDLIS